MEINSPLLGQVEVNKDKIIYFSKGIIGFSDYTKFLLVQEPETPFWYLQSIEEEELYFLLAVPDSFISDYQVELRGEELSLIELDSPQDGAVLNIITVPEGDIEKATINLQGPIVINIVKQIGKQFVLHPSPYTTKYPLFPNSSEGVDSQC